MPFKSKERQAEWQRDHPASVRRNGANYRARIRLEMVKAYGGQCAICGECDPVVLVLDHIKDDAQQDRAKNGHTGGYRMYRQLQLKGWPKDDHQLLCHNCNFRKEYYRRRQIDPDGGLF